MKSILAGILISIGGIAYMSVGGVIGAILFSLGLMTIVTFKYDLFTGKAGLLATGEISAFELSFIWFGNLIGAMCSGIAVQFFPNAPDLIEKSIAIVEKKASYDPMTNLVLGVFCGMLMYIAVTAFKATGNYIFCIAPVTVFIMCGFNHCVADMFYICCNPTQRWWNWSHLIPTTIGNVIGTNLIPFLIKEKAH